MYSGCPLMWTSKLQSEISLSTNEAEYIAMLQLLRENQTLMNLMHQIDVIFKLHIPKPKFTCKVHKDNESCSAMANNPKFSPRTKHIAINYHHFHHHVQIQSNPEGVFVVEYLKTTDQLANILTKPLSDKSFFDLRKRLNGW